MPGYENGFWVVLGDPRREPSKKSIQVVFQRPWQLNHDFKTIFTAYFSGPPPKNHKTIFCGAQACRGDTLQITQELRLHLGHAGEELLDNLLVLAPSRSHGISWEPSHGNLICHPGPSTMFSSPRPLQNRPRNPLCFRSRNSFRNDFADGGNQVSTHILFNFSSWRFPLRYPSGRTHVCKTDPMKVQPDTS